MDSELIKEQAVTRQLILEALKRLELQQAAVSKKAQANSDKLLVIETASKTNSKYSAWLSSIISSVLTAIIVAFVLGKK